MSTLTIPAPKIEVGDIIDGRVVRVVTGRKAHSVSNANAHSPGKANHLLPTSTFSGHVVCVGFEDDGPWKYIFGQKTVEVERGATLPEAA